MIQLLIFLTLAISNCKLLNSFEIEPKQSVVLSGTQFKLKFKIPNTRLQYCQLTSNGSITNLSPFANATNRKMYYYGDGLDNGECGLIIYNVTDDQNGVLTFTFAAIDSTEAEQASTTLIVARPPDSINFVVMKNKDAVDESVNFQIGDELTASCTVKNGRPEPNVTMFFGNEMVSVDVDNLMLSGQQSNAYYFSKNLTQDDDQKEIKCMIDHITKPENNVISRKIRVKYRPIISETMHQKSDNLMNISLQIAANPLEYHYELLHGGKPLDKNNEHIQVESITQREINNGSLSELTILIKTKKLTESKQQIVLNITNELGSTTYPIKLYMSTLNEDFEIGLGMYIIGAVILIVILAVIILYNQRGRLDFSAAVANCSQIICFKPEKDELDNNNKVLKKAQEHDGLDNPQHPYIDEEDLKVHSNNTTSKLDTLV